MNSRVKLVSAATLFIACMGLLPWSSQALGQSHGGGGQMMIVSRNDDGTGGAPQIMHFSMPDIFALRQPDFIKRDLAIFKDKLVLSDAQAASLERQIEAYLARFAALKKEKLAGDGDGPMVFAFGGGIGEDGEEAPMGMMIAAGNPDEMPEIDLSELEEMEGDLPDGMNVDVGVRMTAAVPGPGGEGGGAAAVPAGGHEDGGPEVSVQFTSPNGEDLPEEVRQQLEKRAADIAEKIKAEVAKQQAENPQGGHEGGEDLVAAALPGMGNIEDLQKRQEEMAQRAEEFGKAKVELRQKFVTEAQTPLAPTQVEHWPALERALLREKSLPKGRLPGESTDLFKVARAVSLDESQNGSIAVQLDQYDLALDNALRQRNDFVEDASQKVDKAMQEQHFDRALSIIDKATAMRMAVRGVNLQFSETIATLLPADKAEAFRAAYLKTSYPMVYRQTFGSRTFAAAAKIEGLSDQTRTSIADLQKAYQAELTNVNEQIRKAIDQNDPKETRRPIEHMKQIAAGTPPEEAFDLLDDPQAVRKAFARRQELDKRYAKSVADLLTPEQAAQLPKPPTVRAGEPIIIRRAVGESGK